MPGETPTSQGQPCLSEAAQDPTTFDLSIAQIRAIQAQQGDTRHHNPFDTDEGNAGNDAAVRRLADQMLLRLERKRSASQSQSPSQENN